VISQGHGLSRAGKIISVAVLKSGTTGHVLAIGINPIECNVLLKLGY
jgi:hypothetical protein